MTRRFTFSRLLTIATTMLAWLAMSYHCFIAPAALAQSSAAPMDRMSAGCPMHAQQKPGPQPDEHGNCGYLPCCNNLQAVATAPATIVQRPLWTGLFARFFAPAADALVLAPQQVEFLNDTGPPLTGSFAELVLQRSLLAHAPPSLA